MVTGEAIKAPAEGAMGWPRDYALVRAFDRLRAPPLHEADYEGFVDPTRMADANASLAARPFGGLVVVCPWMPDFHPATTVDLGAYQRFLLETLLPRVRRETPALASRRRRHGGSVDGVRRWEASWHLRIGLTTPGAFGAVGGIQPASAPAGTRHNESGPWRRERRARAAVHRSSCASSPSRDDYFRDCDR